MTYQVTATDGAITLRLALEPVIFLVDGKPKLLLKLPISLPFARKPADLSEFGGGEPCAVYVLKRIEMDPLGFDSFTRNFLRDTDWLKDVCMALPVVNARACIMVVAAGRPILFIDTEGSSYARYVARLG